MLTDPISVTLTHTLKERLLRKTGLNSSLLMDNFLYERKQITNINNPYKIIYSTVVFIS